MTLARGVALLLLPLVLFVAGGCAGWGLCPAARGVDPSALPGHVIDDEDAEFFGVWNRSQATPGFVHRGYRDDGDARDGQASAVFYLGELDRGEYEVRLAYTAGSDRSSRTRVIVSESGGAVIMLIDQRAEPPIDGMFVSLGVYECGRWAPASVMVTNEGADGRVVVDAVQWVRVAE